MGTKRTEERRNHRLPESLSDEQITAIAKEGEIAPERLPILANHLRTLLKMRKNNIASQGTDFEKLYKQSFRALKKNTPDEFRRLSDCLNKILATTRAELERLTAIHASELPGPAELTACLISMETWQKVMLLNGLTSPRPHATRRRGPRIDYFGHEFQLRLAMIYELSAGKPNVITLGYGSVESGYQRFMAAALVHLGWRSRTAEGPAKQARWAYERIRDTARNRLALVREEEEERSADIERARAVATDADQACTQDLDAGTGSLPAS